MFTHFVGMDEDEEEAVPLPNVNSAILKKVIQWATYHKDDPPPPEDDENKEKRTDDISSWDADFLKVDQGTLFELILVCFLDGCVLGPPYACGEQHSNALLCARAHAHTPVKHLLQILLQNSHLFVLVGSNANVTRTMRWLLQVFFIGNIKVCVHFEHFININSFHASVLPSPISSCKSVDCCSQHSVKQPNTRVFVLIFCTHCYQSECVAV